MELYVICTEWEFDSGVQFEIKPQAYKSIEDAR